MALIDNDIELKKHNSSITKQLSVPSIQSFLADAETKYIIPAVGRAQFNATVAAKPTIVVGSNAETLLLALQKASVNFAIAEYANFGAVSIDDSGLFVRKSDSKAPASDKKVMALREQSMSAGYDAIELAVDFLEEHISDFPVYAASDEHIENRSRFINSSREFPQKLPVNPTLFASIKSIISKVEDDYIVTVLGDDLDGQLRTKIRNKSLTELDKELLRMIRKAVGSIAIAEAIPYRLVSFDGTGSYVRSETVGGISGNVENRSPAEIQRMQVTMNKLVTDGESDLERLRLWLNKHTTEYNTYTPSTMAVLNQVNESTDGAVYFL
ncbi:hypothetical protein BDE36_1774 [Arcticibacter tournemirensis]|uniref:Uncharacterized protein n=1 Tax=Arcticibacter tournemirensis TaxID=699437 RepID=A0A5M9HAS2_9SPHI|nr:DUF6712 family protein [Arcticibacter tournemirensis]KAA8483760.1 hypothetical protein F1649_07685 [Arcticibacter tournemirensis]TQM50039.1 hypothetical protein BDE36_1774 [Arcticibacter tournemirensis]